MSLSKTAASSCSFSSFSRASSKSWSVWCSCLVVLTVQPCVFGGNAASAVKASLPDSSKTAKAGNGSKVDKAQGWQQDRHNGLGHEIIYADHKGVRIYYPDCDFNVLSRPPSWDITWFNTRTHQQYTDTLAHYREKKNLSPDSSPPASLKYSSTVYAGVKSRKFAVPKGPYVAYFYVTEPVDLPAGALVFLSSFFGMPNFGGIPLACHQALGKGAERKFWYTISSERKILPKSTFATPVGYYKVGNVDSVNLNEVNKQAEDLAKELKVGVPFGK